MAEFIIPWVKMRAGDEYIRRSSKQYPVLEPFAPRHSISYFNNNKEDSTRSAYERLHKVDGFDPGKIRCDRTKPSLFWSEIHKENKGQKVPMITNHWYGRPNRVQIDYPETRYNRCCRMLQFYDRSGYYNVMIEDDRKICLD